MQALAVVRGAAVPLPLDNVDTDAIVRIDRLAAFDRDQLGPYAFESLRLRPDGSADPACPLNLAVFHGAPILLAGRNFGCGSSREGAVWALVGSGLRCIIAESFGDIFLNNCFQNGLLPIELPREAVLDIAAQAEGGEPVEVDLRSQRITLPDGRGLDFSIDPMKREMLLEGLDDVARTLKRLPVIAAWQLKDRAARPWLWLPVSAAADE